MNFRTRVLVTFLPLALLPLMIFAWFARSEVAERIRQQSDELESRLTSNVVVEFDRQSESIAVSLSRLADVIRDDNRFRIGIGAAPGSVEKRYVLDFAERAMELANLSVLQIQNADGRILSSGHFRNEFDRLDRRLPELLSTLGGKSALGQMRTPETPLVALLRVDSINIAGQSFWLVGGKSIGKELLATLAPASDVSISIAYAGGSITNRDSSAALTDLVPTRSVTIPFIGTERTGVTSALLVVAATGDELQQILQSMDRWLGLAAILALLLTAMGVAILAIRISRPLVELADQTARIDLNKLNVNFRTRRRDEIGRLSNTLAKMTQTLKSSAASIRDAERRATQGELARQVNHDIKNGLTPIRNVFSHLIDLANNAPDELPSVLKQRSQTIESSLAYLATLSANYAKLSPTTTNVPCDLGEIVRRVVDDYSELTTITVRADTSVAAPMLADPVALRRVVENLIDNAIDSLGGSGNVTAGVELVVDDPVEKLVRLTVTDNGIGMDDQTVSRVFDDFFTTKSDGTGLGLSIVRRLVLDTGGRIAVESELGVGSTFVVDFPARATTT